jgi:arylsulfatase A-like enzyme
VLLRAVLAWLLLGVVGRARAQDARPNVVVILADDLGFGDLGCYGQARLRTPHLDALAAEGARFTRAYAAAPVCAPSRCALMTGMHVGHCAVDHNDEPNLPLGLEDPTLAEVLARAGYRTGVVGKWALGGETPEGTTYALASAPWNLGFERSLVVLDQARAQDHFPERLHEDGVPRAVLGNEAGGRGRWDAGLYLERALAFVDESATDPRPFFLYFPSTLPHRELVVPSTDGIDPSWPEPERAYAAMVQRLDADVGALLARLEERGLAERTLVIFASDNGPTDIDGHLVSFFASSGALRGQKRDLDEGGLRVPLLVRGPGVRAGTVDAPVALYDLLPTLAELAGTDAPDGIDGVSLARWLHGEGEGEPHARFYSFASEARGGSEARSRHALREGSLLLIERADDSVELYDLASDPSEAHDLAAERASDVARLREARIAESTGPRRRSWPVLEVRGEGVAPTSIEVPASVPVLDLEVRSSEQPPALGSRIDTPPLAIVATRDARAEDGALVLPSGSYVTVGAHPAIALGDASFTLEARVRLHHLPEGPALTREARRYLALEKPTGARDELLDFAVLAQAGDLAGEGATGHELAVLFADPELGGHGTWALVARELAITDGAFHDLAIRIDAEHRTATFALDGRSQALSYEDLGHVRSDGPLVLGAHHDARGVFDGHLDGAIASFRLSRGLAPTIAPAASARTLVLDLGAIPVGAPDVVRSIALSNAGAAPSRAMDLALARDDADPRLAIDFMPVHTLTRGAAPIPLVLRLRTDTPGPLEETLVLHATASHLGLSAAGAPLAIVVRGEIVPTTAPDTTPTRLVLWLAALAALAMVIAAARRRRSGSPRA